jgi:hypothetical protein
MEKKGNILTQMAIISDLLENVNMVPDTIRVVFDVQDKEYNRLLDYFMKSAKIKLDKSSDTFNVEIGKASFIFSKSSA